MEKLTFEQACEIAGIDPQCNPSYFGLPEPMAKRQNAGFVLDVLAMAHNKQDNFEPDFGNDDQDKYTPWLDFDSSLGSFVLVDARYTNSHTDLGARFWFVSRARATAFFNNYSDLINDLHK